MEYQSANLNIPYDWPIWEYRIYVIYSRTEGWIPGTNRWFNESNESKYISTSLEPAGLTFFGNMEKEEWNAWLKNLKEVATNLLGTKIGEIELGEIGNLEWLDKDLEVIGDYSKVCKNQDHDQIDDLYSKLKPGLSELDVIELEKWIFRLDWHSLHDRIASGFQTRRHPSTAKFLYDQISNNRIPEFEYKPVSRKCVWALADIGTLEAKQYLKTLSESDDSIIRQYAQKRLANWEGELNRKGRMIGSLKQKINTHLYTESEKSMPKSGNCISAFQNEDSIIVYQAYKKSIAQYAIENQKFGGTEFSFNRMTWIKPNYLWMMYRSAWASKENQERILAITITKSGWEELLHEAILTSFKPEYYKSEAEWKSKLANSEVRVQWDPNHDPYGNKLERKAIQVGIKGALLKKFSTEMITHISDITRFVQKQRIYKNHKQLQHLEIPIESIYKPIREDLNIGITNYDNEVKMND